MYKIGLVSYTNVLPFLFGLSDLKSVKLYYDYPSVLSEKFFRGEYDIALLPVASIFNMGEEVGIISDYCIGANGRVDTVMLYSETPLLVIKKIILDYQSITSVKLIKVLDKFFLRKKFEFVKSKSDDYIKDIGKTTAGLVIGDRTFELNRKFPYRYDLAKIWFDFTGLPFVFAVWVYRKDKVSKKFIDVFDLALNIGVENIDFVVNKFKRKVNIPSDELRNYLENRISYYYDYDKKKAVNLFLELAQSV